MRYKFSTIVCLIAFSLAVFALSQRQQSTASPDEYTYYFDGYGANDWDNSGGMTDGSTETHAWTYGNGNTQLLTSNTCPGTDLGTILKVELRVHGAAEYGVEEDDDIILRPVFAGGDGDDHQVDMPDFTTGKGWSVWVDITNDTNAPVSWSWTDVQSLDCDVVHQQVNGLDYMLASKVEIRVTCGTLATYIITATAGTGGTITPSGTVTVTEGGSQTFSITPDGDNSVADVLVDGTSQGSISSYLFTNVTSNRYIEAIFNLSAECSDLSSVPLSAVKHAAPPNIMFVLDDSGSMDWEFLTEEWNGLFGGFRYVFDDPGDNVFSSPSYILSEKHRKKWKSQWSGYNKLYYDPGVDYEAWPTLDDADLDTPPSHPMNGTPTFALNDTYYLFDFGIIVDNLDWSPLYEETGFWDESMFEPEYNGSGRYTNEIGATATFTPDLPAADTYDVYAWWNCWTGRDQNAKITITYEGGLTDTIYRNQVAYSDNEPTCDDPGNPFSPCCGQWTLLGSYPFAAGMAGSVTIERHAGSTADTTTVADAVKFVSTTRSPIDIKNAHYYTFEDADTDGRYDTGEPLYLVLIQGTGGAYTIRYFEATVTGGGATEQVTDLVEVSAASVPDSVKSTRSAEEERRNFANWYSYYRRRELTATAAVANAIVNMQGVNVGLYSINKNLIQPVLSVKAGGEDHTATLLDSLYNLTLVGDT